MGSGEASVKIRDGEPLGSTFRGLAECAILRNEATACGHRVADWDAVGVAAGSRARKRAVAPWTRWREAFVWHRFAGGVLTHPCGSCRPAGSWRRCGRGGGTDCTSLGFLGSGWAYLCVRLRIAAGFVDSFAVGGAGSVDAGVVCL